VTGFWNLLYILRPKRYALYHLSYTRSKGAQYYTPAGGGLSGCTPSQGRRMSAPGSSAFALEAE